MKRTGAFAVVFDKNRERVLVVKRRDTPIWVLPGGGIDPGEPPEEAAVREVTEETGVKSVVVKKLGEYTPINRLTHLVHLFECVAEDEKTSLTDETVDVGFFPVNRLPEPFFQLHAEMVQDALTRKDFPYEKPQSQVTYWNLFKHLLKHPIIVIRAVLARMGFPINR